NLLNPSVAFIMFLYTSCVVLFCKFSCIFAKLLFRISLYWLKIPFQFSVACFQLSMLNILFHCCRLLNQFCVLFMLPIQLFQLVIMLLHISIGLLAAAVLPLFTAFWKKLVFISHICFAWFIWV